MSKTNNAGCASQFLAKGSSARANAADRRGAEIAKRAAAGETLTSEERATLKRYETRRAAQDAAYEAWKAEGARAAEEARAKAEATRSPERIRQDEADARFRAAREAAVARGMADPASAPEWVKTEIQRRALAA